MDTRLPDLPATFLRDVRSRPKCSGQFVELVDVLIDRNAKIQDVLANDEFSRMTAPQRALAALSRFDVQLQNGGLFQFFWNCPQWVEHVHPALLAVGVPELAKAFMKAVKQLGLGIESFVAQRQAGSVDAFLEAVEDNDFEWFEDAYFGEFDESADRWSGLVERLYEGSVGYVQRNLDGFVARAHA